jgi:hypothetical protein
VPHGGDHHADREAVGDGDADQRAVVDLEGGDGRAGADERQREGADELGYRTPKGILKHSEKLRRGSDGSRAALPDHSNAAGKRRGRHGEAGDQAFVPS